MTESAVKILDLSGPSEDSLTMVPLPFLKVIRAPMSAAIALVLLGLVLPSQAQFAGKAVSLSGADYVRTTLWSNQLFDSKSFTFEFWFNATSPGVLVGEADTANVSVWDKAFAEIFAGGVIKAGVPNVPTMTVGTISFGTWNHLAIVYNQTNQTLSAYLNGVLANTSNGNRQAPSDLQPSRTSVYTFGRGGPTNLNGGNWLSGKYDEIRIWRTARDASQIANNWNHIITTDEPGLMALWHLDTANGSRSPDSRSAGDDPAWYVPDTSIIPLVTSTAPLLGPLPSITTKAATATGTSAVIQGTANPEGSPMSVFFQWGTTTSYGNNTTTNAIGSGIVDINFSENLANLPIGTYHFQAVGISGDSTFKGGDQTFTILAPTATTKAALVSANSAQLSGSGNAHGTPSSVYFEWGLTTVYGNSTPARDIGSGSTDVNYSETLSNLSAGTYHFRAVASYAGGVSNGEDNTFTIVAPSVQTKPAVVTEPSVKLQGAVNPQGISASVYFQYGSSISYGNSTPLQAIGSGSADVNFSETINNLPAGDYHFRAVLTNTTQQFFGTDQTFSLSGVSGKAVALSGNDYLRTTLWTSDLFTNEDFTFELWFNASGPGILINEADTSDPSVWDYAFAEVFPGGVIKAGVPGVTPFVVGTIAFGAWHHLALVYDSTNKVLSAYLDGASSGSSPGERTSPADVHRTSIYCFGRGGETNLGGGNWFTGLIDEVRIWRRPLSAQEIALQFNKILNITDPSLMGNWHLDVLSATTYLSPDASGKNNSAWYVPQTTMPLVASTAPVVPDLRPVIVANSARSMTPFCVEVSASVNAEGTNTVVYFEYGRSNIFQQTATQDIGFGNAGVTVTQLISGLEAGVTYDYRSVASNAFGITRSALSQFTVTGWAGTAYHLAPNDYLRTTNNLASQFVDKSITVELWFYPTKAGVIASETVFSPVYDRAIIEILPSANVQAGFNGLTPISVGDAVFNTWNHVALRYDAASQTMDGFLNGVKGPSRTGTRNTPSSTGAGEQFAFGRGATTKLGTGEYFGGDLDEISIWNVARSDQDITSGRFYLLAGDEPGLILNWRGNPLATDRITDTSPHNNAGQNFGADVIVSTAPLTWGLRRLSLNQIETEFVVKGGSNYIFETTSDFATWTPIATNTAPASGFVKIPVTLDSQPGPKFFRVIAQ
jgi:hypothetical protein